MSLLSESVVKAFFEDALFSVEVRKQGQTVGTQAPDWQVHGSSADTDVMFTFDRFTSFDELVVVRSGEVVDRQSFGGQVSLPPGAEWEHHVSVTLLEV